MDRLILINKENEWIETIINCNCNGSDVVPCKKVWNFIMKKDVEIYKRRSVPIGSNSRIQQQLGLRETKMLKDELIKHNWFHEDGKYIMSHNAYLITKYKNYKAKENKCVYKLSENICKNHNFYDVTLIEEQQTTIGNICEICATFCNENKYIEAHHTELYDLNKNYSTECKCENIIITSNEICLLCGPNKINIYDKIQRPMNKMIDYNFEIKCNKNKNTCKIHDRIYTQTVHYNKHCDQCNINFKENEIKIYNEKNEIKNLREKNLLVTKKCSCLGKVTFKDILCPICDIDLFKKYDLLNLKFNWGKYKNELIIDVVRYDHDYVSSFTQNQYCGKDTEKFINSLLNRYK
jgi:hypothetical protein